MNNNENNEIKFDFGERLKDVAWIEYNGIRAINTACNEGDGDLLICKAGPDGNITSNNNNAEPPC